MNVNTTVQEITLRVTVPTEHLGVLPRYLSWGSALRDWASSRYYVEGAAYDAISVEVLDAKEAEYHEDLPYVNLHRLVGLAAWAAGEKAKADLGLPSEWHQGAWYTKREGVNSCGTACCIAGKALLDEGYIPSIALDENWAGMQDGVDGSQFYKPGTTRDDDERERVSARDEAQERLGLTDTEAGALFEGNNELEDVLRVIGEIIEKRRQAGKLIESVPVWALPPERHPFEVVGEMTVTVPVEG